MHVLFLLCALGRCPANRRRNLLASTNNPFAGQGFYFMALSLQSSTMKSADTPGTRARMFAAETDVHQVFCSEPYANRVDEEDKPGEQIPRSLPHRRSESQHQPKPDT